MGRYSDINRGPELNEAYNTYQTWLKKTRAQKQTAYKAVSKPASDRVKVERTPGYILPFNSDNDKVYIETRIVADTQQGAGGTVAGIVRNLVADRVNKTLPTTGDVFGIDVPKFQFAKIYATLRTTTATNDSESRITGLPYKRHRSNSCSSAFGRKNATDDYSDAVKAIKAANEYKNFVATTGNSIGFSPEGD